MAGDSLNYQVLNSCVPCFPEEAGKIVSGLFVTQTRILLWQNHIKPRFSLVLFLLQSQWRKFLHTSTKSFPFSRGTWGIIQNCAGDLGRGLGITHQLSHWMLGQVLHWQSLGNNPTPETPSSSSLRWEGSGSRCRAVGRSYRQDWGTFSPVHQKHQAKKPTPDATSYRSWERQAPQHDSPMSRLTLKMLGLQIRPMRERKPPYDQPCMATRLKSMNPYFSAT